MFASEFHFCTLWWIFPLLMIILCIFMMKGRMGAMMCRPGSCSKDSRSGDISASALELLNKRYAQGELNKEEYEEKRSLMARETDHHETGDSV
jgi:uncharacterized membrane protein